MLYATCSACPVVVDSSLLFKIGRLFLFFVGWLAAFCCSDCIRSRRFVYSRDFVLRGGRIPNAAQCSTYTTKPGGHTRRFACTWRKRARDVRHFTINLNTEATFYPFHSDTPFIFHTCLRCKQKRVSVQFCLCQRLAAYWVELAEYGSQADSPVARVTYLFLHDSLSDFTCS